MHPLYGACAAKGRKLDAVEIHESLAKGPCSKKKREKVSLEMVLYVLSQRKESSAARRSTSGRG
jgi:hypothetical protein